MMRRAIFFATALAIFIFSALFFAWGTDARHERDETRKLITLLLDKQDQTKISIEVATAQIGILSGQITLVQEEIEELIVVENMLLASIAGYSEIIQGLNVDISSLENEIKKLDNRRIALENKKTELESTREWLISRKAELESQQAELEEAVRQAKAKKIKSAPGPIPVPTPVDGPKYFAQTIYVVSPELEPYVRGAIALLARSLGYSPFQVTGPGGDIEILLRMPVLGDRIIAEAAPRWLNPWVEKQWININPYCFPRVGGWEETIAHELGHMLGWRDLDGHPYMAVPLVSGTYYGDNLVVMCR